MKSRVLRGTSCRDLLKLPLLLLFSRGKGFVKCATGIYWLWSICATLNSPYSYPEDENLPVWCSLPPFLPQKQQQSSWNRSDAQEKEAVGGYSPSSASGVLIGCNHCRAKKKKKKCWTAMHNVVHLCRSSCSRRRRDAFSWRRPRAQIDFMRRTLKRPVAL